MASILWVKLKRMGTELYLYVIMILMSLVLSFVFGKAMFGGETARRVYTIDHDGTPASAAFLSRIGSGAYALTAADEKEAETAVSKGDALAAIVIPEGFSESLAKGATVTLVRTAESADIIAFKSVVSSAVTQTAHVYALFSALNDARARIGLGLLTEAQVEQAYAARTGENAAIKVISARANQKEISWDNIHYLMGFNIFFVMFSIVFTIGGILEDKKLNTWNRIRISPVTNAAVLGGNFIPSVAVGLIQMLIVLGFGQMLFGIDLGESFWPVVAVFSAFVLSATCLGLMMSMLLNTYEQLNAVTPVVLVATSMLGGCMWPLSIVGSEVMYGIACAMPQKWAVEASESLAMQGGGLISVLPGIGVLLGMAAVYFIVSLLLYNKKQRV